MSYSFNAVLLLSILIIINVKSLDSTKLLARNQPASPCCQQPSYFTLFSYLPCSCSPPATVAPPKRVPVDLNFKELALKPVEILAGASHLALGTILNIGGMPFKFVGSLAKNGGQFAETLGYDLKTTGALKVSNGVSSLTSILQKFGQPAPVICVVQDDKINIYQPVEKKEKVEKIEKIEKVDKVVKVEKVASPCCQQPPVFNLFSYSPCACPSSPLPTPIDFNFKELALKPFEFLAGASHLALGTILNIGGMPFKFIGTVTKNGGEFAETLGYDLKTTGVNKVSNSVSSITSLLQKFGQPAPVICVVQDDKVNIYQPVEKKEKVEKVAKIEKVEKIEKGAKVVKVEAKPTPYTPTTTVKYETTTKYSAPITKYSAPPVTTPYVPTTIAVKPIVTTYSTAAPKTPYVPPVETYDAPVSDIPYLSAEGNPLGDEDDYKF